MQSTTNPSSSWLDRPILSSFRVSRETLLLSILLILAIITRFYLLDARVISHDETIHVYHNSWALYTGQGYRHDPLSHGPFQFHLVALSYFLFGANDLTARIPAALFSIASVAFIWFYRRYLGKAGMFIAMAMMLISPILLFYGRYVREDIYAAFSGVVMLWGMLRYMETGLDKYTLWVGMPLVLHFTDKETAFIYAAQALLFLGLFFIYQVGKREWVDSSRRIPFIATLLAGLGSVGAAGLFLLSQRRAAAPSATQTVAPAIPGQTLENLPVHGLSPLALSLLILGAVALLAALFFLIRGYSWQRLRQERSFGLLVLIGTLVMPMLSAFPVYFVGWNVPTNATEITGLNMTDIWHIAVFLVPLTIAAIAIGLLWNPRLWLINAAAFYAFFTIFYTTLFTNGAGFFTGLVGSLGYWLKQQGVQRGSQPWYYYILVQIPVYEYLPAFASLFGFGLLAVGKRPLLRFTQSFRENQAALAERELIEASHSADLSGEALAKVVEPLPVKGELESAPILALLSFWVVASVFAYTVAGEKMPWLTVHIAWPMILFGGWALGYLVDTTDWSYFRKLRGWLVLLVLIIFLMSFSAAIASLLGSNPPFRGMGLDQLEATSTFITSFLVALASGFVLWRLVFLWPLVHFARLVLVTIFAIFAGLTARTAFQANYINYDNANELLVYAHSAGGVKEVMKQVEEISRRTTDGNALSIAYDGEYPFWWYLRNYPNARYFGSTPSRSLRDVPVIIVGDTNFGKIEPIVGQAYDKFDYIRLWWPNQDYFNLTWERVKNAILDPKMRAALFDIWLDRDYTKYGQVTGKDMSLENWNPAARMRLYIRKDITSKLWNYGSAPVAQEVIADPYEGKQVQLFADKTWGESGSQPGQFQRPRDIAFAPAGTLYVADTDNHRIQHLSADGASLQSWGSFADIAQGQAPGGTFYQPWGIAVGPDGSVYVADTWNHRVQKFTPDGKFITMWGYFGTAEKPEAFWGPRDIAVDSKGRVYITDTGNKRVVVFDADGNFLTQFGAAGLDLGQFDEPVGLAIDNQGKVYVADTWNQRIQVFSEVDGTFVPERMWDVAAWYGQSLDNKPYLAVDAAGDVFATDPEGYRVLQFNNNGDIIRYWGDYGIEPNMFGLAGSVAVDPQGGVWVSDTGNSRLMHFTLPAP
jgi:predicted membrane-bound mannosyltransferase/DNA-binding beta-propeller fold protein YncE